MVTHVVIFTWIDSATAEQIVRLHTALAELSADMSELVTISHGPDCAYRDGNGDYALVAVFRDRAGWDAYQSDPRHKTFVRDIVTPLQASRLTIQF